MKNCIFCQIVKGKIPCWQIYEDRDFLAFLDIAPFCEGHTLVIPKKHYRWVWDIPNVGQYFSTATKIINHYRKKTGNDWVTISVWGTEIPHAHIQIIPWPKKLALGWPKSKLTQQKAEELIKKFKMS